MALKGLGVPEGEARALRWQHVDLNGDPAASPPVPPHVAVWRSVRGHGLVGHASTRTTEIVFRRELRPVITTGAEITDQLFTAT